MKTVGTLNYRNFVKENHIRILGLMLKRKISTSTILSSFLPEVFLHHVTEEKIKFLFLKIVKIQISVITSKIFFRNLILDRFKN